MAYTIEHVMSIDIDEALIEYIKSAGSKLNLMYGTNYKVLENFDLYRFADTNYLWVCKRDGQYVGFLAASRMVSFFDRDVVQLVQQLLYAEPGTRASLLLLREFVDFGKRHADHVISVIGNKTNIKKRSLERLGFKELETVFLLGD